MAKKIIPLTDRQIKGAKPKDKAYKLFDGQGLFLLVNKTGGKLWRLKYKSPLNGKERTYSIGSYPDITLVVARAKRQELREKIANGIDPMEEKKENKVKKAQEEIKKSDTFQKVSEEYFNFIQSSLSQSHLNRQKARLKNDIYPYIGNTPISEVNRTDIINAVKKIEERGAIETAHRVYALCNSVFKYAVANEKLPHNIMADIDKKHILQTPTKQNYPTITEPKEIKYLLEAIESYKGEAITRYALQLLPYVVSRPGNFRAMKWEDIDFKNSQWIIPGNEMKVKIKKKDTNEYQPHIVPLSKQAMKIIKELQPLTSDSTYVFHSSLSKHRPMSDNTLNTALKRLGYKGQMNPHSFRAMFSTIAHEHIDKHSFHSGVIERQLAHKETNKVKSAYDHSEYLPQRKKLMQWWADWLDEVKSR